MRFTFAIGAVVAIVACGVNVGRAQPAEAGMSPRSAGSAAKEAEVSSTLQDLERQVARHAATRPSISALETVQAAHQFATRTAGNDDVKWVQAFKGSLETAQALQRPTVLARVYPPLSARAAADEGMFMIEEVPAPPARLESALGRWDADPKYAHNARQLVNAYISSPSDLFITGGGTPDTGNKFPDCVVIGTADVAWCCSGTLIAPNVVVTAGHCEMAGCTRFVFVGQDTAHLESGKVFEVANHCHHPDYGTRGDFNDIAVLILKEDVTGVRPRALASTEMVDGTVYARVVGYGTTDPDGRDLATMGVRRYCDVPVRSAACSAEGDGAHFGCDPGSELVIGNTLGSSSCKGDSGGPIMIQDAASKAWFLAAVTSRSLPLLERRSGHLCGDGAINARVDRFKSWIQSVPGGHWNQPPPHP